MSVALHIVLAPGHSNNPDGREKMQKCLSLLYLLNRGSRGKERDSRVEKEILGTLLYCEGRVSPAGGDQVFEPGSLNTRTRMLNCVHYFTTSWSFAKQV